jgi:hypothetical protein
MNNKIELGDEAQDIITGLTGIVIAQAKYLWGCDRFYIQPQKLENEKITEAIWFDEPQLIVITKQKLYQPKRKTGEVPPGGPQEKPQKNPNPIRR